MSDVRKKIVQAGIRNLKEYGYPDVDSESIITDMIYSAFFSSMLKDNLGVAGQSVDAGINGLLQEIAAQQEQPK